MTLRTLDAGRAEAVETLCELIVPGSSRVGPAVYVDALIAGMPPPVQRGRAGLDRRTRARRGGGRRRPRGARATPEFGFVRALAIEAYYSDFVAPGKRRARRLGGDRLQLAARDAPEEGLVVPGDRVRTNFDVVVVGSGAGRRRRRRRARAARARRAAARVRSAPPGSRLHALGGEGGARSLLAAALRAAPRTVSSSRSSPVAASAARRRSTRRWHCARTSATSRSGIRRPG